MARKWAVLGTAAVLPVGGFLLLRSPLMHPVIEWEQYAANDRGIVVYVLGGECRRVSEVEVDETSDRVEVTTRLNRPDWLITSCSDVGTVQPVDVVLDDPLGDRPVYDGACLARGLADEECLRSAREAGARPSG